MDSASTLSEKDHGGNDASASKPGTASRVRAILIGSVGNLIEWYDVYAYSAFALYFAPAFFPSTDPVAQQLSAAAVFAAAFVIRPVGGILFGWIADRHGRRRALLYSVLLMCFGSLLIAVSPTHAQIGAGASVILIVARLLQGLSQGGEYGASATYLAEMADPRHRGFYSGVWYTTLIGGQLAAVLLLLLLQKVFLTPEELKAWGWRIPFVASAVLVGLGLLMLAWTSLVWLAALGCFATGLGFYMLPVLFKRHLGAVLAGTAGAIACFAIFYLSTAYALAQGTTALGYSRETFLAVQLGANCFFALGILLAVIRADQTSPRAVMLLGGVMTIVLGAVFGAGLTSGSLLVIFVTLSVALMVMGFVYGPLGSWLPTLFPVTVRYSGISLAFNVGGIVGGALTPIGAQKMAELGQGGQVGLLLSLAGLATLIGVAVAKENPQSV